MNEVESLPGISPNASRSCMGPLTTHYSVETRDWLRSRTWSRCSSWALILVFVEICCGMFLASLLLCCLPLPDRTPLFSRGPWRAPGLDKDATQIRVINVCLQLGPGGTAHWICRHQTLTGALVALTRAPRLHLSLVVHCIRDLVHSDG